MCFVLIASSLPSYHHLKSVDEGNKLEFPLPMISDPFPKTPRLARLFGKRRQKRRVSSPEPVTILLPSGDIAK